MIHKSNIQKNMKKLTFKIVMVILISALAISSSFAVQKRTAVTGDSVTQRTSMCQNETYESCINHARLRLDQSYASTLSAESFYNNLVISNTGRGGDTCLTQGTYPNGPYIGQTIGLLHRLSSTVIAPALAAGATEISVLIGANDIRPSGYNENKTDVINCIKSVWSTLQAAGFKVIAMTYHPTASTDPTDQGDSNANPPVLSWAEAIVSLNQAIRQAVIDYNATHDDVNLVDAELAYPAEDVESYTESDGIHPNSLGALKIARRWYLDY